MDQPQPTTSALHNEHMVPAASLSSVHTSIQSLKPNEEMRLIVDQQLTIPNNESGNAGTIFSNLKPQTVQLPVKRKSSMENVVEHRLSPREVMPNKKIGQLEHRPWLNIYSPTLAGVLESRQWATKKKRTTKFKPGPPIFGFQKCSTTRSLPIKRVPSPRVLNDPNETMRSKLRESISAALTLVTEKEKEQSLSSKDTSTNAGAIAYEPMQQGSHSAEFASVISAEHNKDSSDNACENNMKSQLSGKPCDVGGNNSLQTYESVGDELSIADMLQDHESIDGNLFVDDDLLQGNGLSWVLDFDGWVGEKDHHEPEKETNCETVVTAQGVKISNSPQTLALQIELELFKLFDGVTKKYKEKGRSLLFNLKDKNNPELREKVMSGEISPARLCSMTAEELASNELSEWRIAKAEEFEHMKILPDSDIDLRRLVKKTHKGEYQVEVEEYDVSVEVDVGSSSIPQIITETQSLSGPISDGDSMDAINGKVKLEVKKINTTTIPSNISSDQMQGVIEDDLKDAEFLTPVVSINEFMELIQKEKKTEHVFVDADKTAASLDNGHSYVPLETKSSKVSPDSPTSVTTDTRDNLDSSTQDTDTKPTDSQLAKEVSPPIAVSKGERIWEGTLQLNNSSKISVSGFFKSGEKATTKNWHRALEIKGRVRMDAFEKFLHDLKKSRSRAIMVMHLILKENEGKESASLSHVVDSYVSDDRVGFAELARGLEAYVCPSHPKIMDRIGKHLAKELSKACSLADGDKGLIGIIIWRKLHVSPNPSSQLKQSLKRHQQEHKTFSRTNNHHHDKNMNENCSRHKHMHPTVPFVPPKVTPSLPMQAATIDDDGPPGFNQLATKEDDDLPEFNFSSEINRPVSTQKPIVASQNQNPPADQIQQLIEIYGKSGLVLEPWDDDDDIPEWQPPQMSLAQAPQPVHSASHINRPLTQPMVASQQTIPRGWPQQQHQSNVWMNTHGTQQGQF